MSDLALLLGRIGLSVLFIVAGLEKFVAIGGVTGTLTNVGFPMPELVAYLVALIELGGGLLILVGIFTRPISLVLALYVVGTIFVVHHFWTMEGPARGQNKLSAEKNLAIIGGFLALSAAGAGAYSLDARRKA